MFFNHMCISVYVYLDCLFDVGWVGVSKCSRFDWKWSCYDFDLLIFESMFILWIII